MPYGEPYYGENLYGEINYNPFLIWSIEIDWNDDGYYDGYNEAVRCVGMSIRRGRELSVESGNGFEHTDIGEARITLTNYDDRYNYYNTSSPYYPNVKQGKYIRIRVLNGATSAPQDVFAGIITDIEIQRKDKTSSYAILTCKDGWHFLENKKTNINVLSSITTGTAIAAILNDIDWPAIWGSSIDPGVDTLDYFWATNKNARNAIDELNDSEFGIVRIAASGRFEFYERGHEPAANISITQDDLLKDISIPAPWKTTRNKAIVHVYQRVLRTTVTLYEITNVPSIAPGETLVIWGDLSYEGRNIASNSISQPIKRNIYANKSTIAFVASTKKITDSANGLIGFTTGMKIFVSGARNPANNGTFTVVTGGVAGEIVVSESLVDELAGASITIDQAVSCFTANAEAGGGGADMSSYVATSATVFGERAKISIYNAHATNTLYLTYYRIVGNAIDCPNPSTVEYPENSAITGEIKPFELDVPWLSVAQYASNYAKFLKEYLNATEPFPIVQIDTRPEYQFVGDLFDKIGLSIEKYSINATDYKICKIEHNWKAETGQSILTKWYTEKRAAAASGGDTMVNGDFETGDLSNWTTISSIEIGPWTIRTSAADNSWRSVCWSPELSLFVAVAYTGTGNRVMTSPDGINWTIRTSAADNSWRSVCWSPELSLFVAVADSGTGNRVMTSFGRAIISVVDTDKSEGTYALFFSTIPSTAGTQSVTSSRIAAIGDQTYKIKLATKETLTADDLHTIQCNATEVAYIDSNNAATNFHNSNIVGGYSGGSAFRALYKFDFSSIPSEAIIKSATLKNTLTTVDSQLQTNITLYRNTGTWADTTVTWNTKPAYEPTGIGSLALLSNETAGIKSMTLAPDYLNEILNTWTDNGFTLVASPEGGTVETTQTIYWREYYTVYKTIYFGGGRTDIIPTIAYRLKSKTYTVSSTTSNKYTFNNTPYINLTYNTITYPRPHYTVYIKWYDAASGGNLIRTDTICSENQQTAWNIRSIQLNSPATALSYAIVIEATRSDATFYIDDIQVIPLGYY